MTVRDLIEQLQKADPDAVVLLWATDETGKTDGWYPLHTLEDDPAVQTDDGDWMSSDAYPGQSVPALWLWGPNEGK